MPLRDFINQARDFNRENPGVLRGVFNEGRNAMRENPGLVRQGLGFLRNEAREMFGREPTGYGSPHRSRSYRDDFEDDYGSGDMGRSMPSGRLGGFSSRYDDDDFEDDFEGPDHHDGFSVGRPGRVGSPMNFSQSRSYNVGRSSRGGFHDDESSEDDFDDDSASSKDDFGHSHRSGRSNRDRPMTFSQSRSYNVPRSTAPSSSRRGGVATINDFRNDDSDADFGGRGQHNSFSVGRPAARSPSRRGPSSYTPSASAGANGRSAAARRRHDFMSYEGTSGNAGSGSYRDDMDRRFASEGWGCR